jgi:hypothetical protein
MGEQLAIWEAALAGVGLLGYHHLHPAQFCIVGQHRNEPSMWKENGRLIHAPPQTDPLLPAIVLTDDKCVDLVLDEMIHYPSASDMEITVYLSLAFVGENFEAV